MANNLHPEPSADEKRRDELLASLRRPLPALLLSPILHLAVLTTTSMLALPAAWGHVEGALLGRGIGRLILIGFVFAHLARCGQRISRRMNEICSTGWAVMLRGAAGVAFGLVAAQAIDSWSKGTLDTTFHLPRAIALGLFTGVIAGIGLSFAFVVDDHDMPRDRAT